MHFANTRKLCQIASGLFFGLSLGACAGDVTESFDDEDLDYTVVGELTWNQCAKQDGYCAFKGTRKVRYGAGTRFTTRTFTNGAWCNNLGFSVNFGTSGNTCSLGTETDAGAAVSDSGAHTMGDAGMAGMGDAGMAMGDAGMAMGDASMAGMTGMTGMGPTIDRSRIPTGNPGVSGVEIRATNDRPAAGDGVGAFRTKCQFSHMNFDDAIVFPNKPGAAHLHAYFGNSGANASSTQSSLRNSGNSTCRGGTANRSSYWVPAVVDGSGAPVKPIEADIYYKTGYNGVQASAVKAFPPGLRMIAGDAKSSATQSHAYWGCHNNYIGHPGSIPSCPAGDNVVMYIVFPQCWDGVNLDSADHKSHLAYPSGGRCPTTHPVAIPEITFNVYYAQPSGGTSGWRLSSDMYDSAKPGGFSAHGDYFEAWDSAIVQTFIRNCDNTGLDCHSHLLGDGRMIYNSME